MHASALVAAMLVGQLMSAEKAASLRVYFPRVDDAKIQSVLSDPNLILYTDAEIEPAYQQNDGALPGLHAVSYNISADQSEPFGNGNREFPWGTPAGLHKSRHSVFRFLLLPVVRGVRLPVVWFRRLLRGDDRQSVCWVYPVGTVVGEVLIQNGPDGHGYAFEVRTRTRERGQWAVDAFRPFPTPEALAERLKELGYAQPVSFGQPTLRTLADQHPRQTFRSTALVEELPPLPASVVAKLLTTTPFKSALGTAWRETDQHVAAAPTTSQAFHIVPPNYEAGFIQVDSQSCKRCHENTLDHVDDFDAGRDWYGRIRGSDGIFSFHPFARESISHNGFGRPVRMNPRLEQAGIVEPYDAAKHPANLYHELDK
jgi:hypothetical protein